MSRPGQTDTPLPQPSETAKARAQQGAHTMIDTPEYDDLTFEDRDAIDAQNHDLALAILRDGNEF